VVVLWTARAGATSINIARSNDGGRSFEPASPLQGPGAAGDRGWPSLALDSDGTAHAFWLDHRGLAAGGAAGAGARHRSGDPHDGVAMAQRSSLYYAPAGSLHSPERAITRGVCYCCKTAAVAGPGGRIYAAWRHVYPGNIRDIAFTRSEDGGRTFAAPARLSDDGWQIAGCPDDGPAMAIDGDGAVHVVWPTVLGGATPEGALFHAVSVDGRTFSRRRRIPTPGSPHPVHPQLAITGDGRVVAAWEERVAGRRVAAARVIATEGARDRFGPIVTLSADEPGIYPVLAASGAGLVAVWATGGERSVVKVRSLDLD
jgi:hypothetical protein